VRSRRIACSAAMIASRSASGTRWSHPAGPGTRPASKRSLRSCPRCAPSSRRRP